MKHKELTNHIQGSFLKKQFLEAFLVQSAYIESLLKLYIDYTFFLETEGASFTNKMLDTFRESVERYGMAQVVSFLYKSELITDEQKKLLDSYRVRRNKVMHDLLGEINDIRFEEELEAICKKGTEIIENKAFKEMAELIENYDGGAEESTQSKSKQKPKRKVVSPK